MRKIIFLIGTIVIVTGVLGVVFGPCLNSVQVSAITGAIALGGLVGLLYYAFQTKIIAEGTERNTRAIEKSNLGFYPSLSFHPDDIRINIGNFVSQDAGQWFIFSFYVFNRRPVAGKVKVDFHFLKREEDGALVDSGIFIFSESVFDPRHEPEAERYYDFQPDQMNTISARIDKKLFEAWIDSAYPGIGERIRVQNVTVNHKIGEIYRDTNQQSDVTQPSRLFIRIKLTARPYGLDTQDYDYTFEKTFYLRFRGGHFDNWDIVAHM